MTTKPRPLVLVVFYANPDHYPPTFNAVSLLAERFDVRVVCRKSDRESRLWPPGVRLDRVGLSRTMAESMAASKAEKARELGAFTWAVKKSLRRERPDVVLAYEPHALVAVSLAGCRAPVVYQRHEVEELDQLDLRSLGGWVSRYALRASASVALTVFPEATRARYYQTHVSLAREPLIVPNFPLVRSFPIPDFDVLLPERARSRQLFYRGAVGPVNGVREAIDAFAALDPAWSLRICGPSDPSFSREIEARIAQCGVGDRSELAGFVPFDELNRQTLRASVGLMLYQAVSTNWTHIATANNKLYEYAAAGVPAVVPDRAAFRDLLSEEGWVEFVDERDPSSIAAGIRRILADRASYDRRAREARRRFEERFNYERVFGPMLARILELAGGT